MAPHFIDREAAAVRELVDGLRPATVIDVFLPPLEVISRIASCEFILSSSLHGLVVADALGIPNAWIQLSDQVKEGGV